MSVVSDNMNDGGVTAKLESLRRSRAGKKGSITKRVKQLKGIVDERGSRTRLQYLLTALLEVQKQANLITSEILVLSENGSADISWQEDVTFTVNDCASVVHSYLESRKDDPDSDLSVAQSRIEQART